MSIARLRGAQNLIVGAALFLFLAACQGPTQASLAVLPPDGRYAVQWRGYLGVLAGQDAYPQFAFVDVLNGGSFKDRGDPVIGHVLLLTDRGDVAAEVLAITPRPQLGNFRLFTVQTRVDQVELGRYTWSRIRFVDEEGIGREIAVGRWVMDVRPGAAATWREDAVALGGTNFGLIEVSLQNTSREPYTIRGLHAELPGTTLETQMFASTPASTEAEPSAPVDPNLALTDAVEVPPGAVAHLTFVVATGTETNRLAWVEFQPFIRYSAAAGDERLFSISPQLYTAQFANDSDLRQYVLDLPADAATGLP
ncbi:MAG TPA: hypothetical protein VLM76_02165 [Patescibacteria group bacterium]|nr:hypothetical protein [Patescibacteria group bacterium]